MAEKVLVTGACGFVGPFMIEELQKKGYEVRATDLPEADYSAIERQNCEIVPANLLKLKEALKAMDGVDRVVHTAARMNYFMTRPEYELANYHVTVTTCEAALSKGVKHFVHFSTCDTYGPPEYSPVYENYPQKPINLYSITKLFGEQAALRYHKLHGLPVTVIRPTTIYGPRCVYVMGLFLGLPVLLKETGLKMVPLPKDGFNANLVHVEDIVGAAAFLLEKDEAIGQAYNVSDDSAMPYGGLIEVLLNSVGIETKRVLPSANKLIAIGASAISHFPQIFFTKVTEFFQSQWDKVITEHRLVPAMSPRFDPGFTSFGRGEYYFSNEKLKKLGYKLRYPDLRKGWFETVRWYMENEWIPTYEQIESE
ncbi:MAG: NAD(P)-dependent oxidoreductase [Actinomycetota bacterium]|nr:NAD(P)-dependent oxidoreductase [Actinomycetota bacterium]